MLYFKLDSNSTEEEVECAHDLVHLRASDVERDAHDSVEERLNDLDKLFTLRPCHESRLETDLEGTHHYHEDWLQILHIRLFVLITHLLDELILCHDDVKADLEGFADLLDKCEIVVNVLYEECHKVLDAIRELEELRVKAHIL